MVQARLVSAQGELPAPPPLARDFTVVDLRNAQGEVGTLEFVDPARPGWSIGRSVVLDELALTGLRDDNEKTLRGRALACPSCGAALHPTLASTQSLSCPQCRAVVDIAEGVGAELQHYAQNNSGEGGLEPQIPLGRIGTLALGGAPQPWQVVGFLERVHAARRRRWRRRAVLLARVPAVPPHAGLRLPGRRRRRLELGQADHRRAAAAGPARALGRPELRTARALRRARDLGAGRVLLARAARRGGAGGRLRGHRAVDEAPPVARADRPTRSRGRPAQVLAAADVAAAFGLPKPLQADAAARRAARLQRRRRAEGAAGLRRRGRADDRHRTLQQPRRLRRRARAPSAPPATNTSSACATARPACARAAARSAAGPAAAGTSDVAPRATVGSGSTGGSR